MSSPTRPSLATLNPIGGPYARPPSPGVTKTTIIRPAGDYAPKSSMPGHPFLWFLVVGAITWLLLYLIKPRFVLKRTPSGEILGEVDPMRVLWASLIIAALALFILWLVNRCR